MNSCNTLLKAHTRLDVQEVLIMESQKIYDDVDYSIMVDLTRYGEDGTLPAELVANDTACHEWLCDHIEGRR